jgi:hypothetical protein
MDRLQVIDAAHPRRRRGNFVVTTTWETSKYSDEESTAALRWSVIEN